MRLDNLFPAPNVAAACSAYETEKAVRAKMFRDEVEFQIGLEKMKVATSPIQWVNDWTADPTVDLALLYKQAALFYNEPEILGQIVKTIFENRLREVAEYIVGQQS